MLLYYIDNKCELTVKNEAGIVSTRINNQGGNKHHSRTTIYLRGNSESSTSVTQISIKWHNTIGYI